MKGHFEFIAGSIWEAEHSRTLLFEEVLFVLLESIKREMSAEGQSEMESGAKQAEIVIEIEREVQKCQNKPK